MAVADGSTPPAGMPSQQYPQLGMPSQQYPPPLPPKPGKDNARLQKFLKRTAKRKSCPQTSQSAVPFRSSLSPVNEASPDLEHSDNSTPPRTPETPFTLRSIQPAPRFAVRTLYQHMASPYPQRAAYGQARSMSTQVAAPPPSYMQEVSTFFSLSDSPVPGQAEQPTVPRIVLPEVVVAPAFQVKKPVPVSHGDVPADPEPPPVRRNTQPTPKSPVPTPYSTAGGQALFRPVLVLAPIIKSKSPRPTFRATELSRSPKPLFDVPQIRMYTASTSYYESSRTPPVFDTATLMAIGSMVPHGEGPAETKQDEAGREATSQPSSSVTHSPRKAATSDAPTGTAPALEIRVPTPETLTPSVRRASPTPHAKRTMQTPENKRATPTANSGTATPTDTKPIAPLSEITAKTHTYEFEMMTAQRPGTPALATLRPGTPAPAALRPGTPAFEVPRMNPLLFAVTAIPEVPQRSSVSQTLSDANTMNGSQSVKTVQVSAELLSRDTHSNPTPAGKPESENPDKLKPESDWTTPMTRPVPPSAVANSQRPKTPTYEANRLLSTSPVFKRPKTPTYGIPRPGVSPVAFQQAKRLRSQTSSYRGLTPAEYAAYGGIRTYSPAFGISSTTTATQQEVDLPAGSETPSQGASRQAAVGGSKTKNEDELQQVEEKGAPIPAILVSQASYENNGTKGTLAHQVAARQDTSWTPEPPVVSFRETYVKQETRSPPADLKTKVTEGKRPLCGTEEQVDLKARQDLLEKGKVQTPEQEPGKQNKIQLLKEKEPVAAMAITSKDSPASPQVPVKTKLQTPASDNKETEDPPAAEPPLKVLPKGIKSKPSGWSRLKKHLVVEQEEPSFPDTEPHKQADELEKTQVHQQDHETADDKAHALDSRQTSGSPKATKMWDAVLFQMFSSKENIMHQIQLNKSETEQSKEHPNDERLEVPAFAYRLPLLLFSPKFDAKKLKEAASRPLTKISTVFEMGLIGRKGKEEEPKDFNRTARGFV